MGREEIDVWSRRVGFRHAWGEGDRRDQWGGGNLGLGLAAAVLTLAAAFFFEFPAAGFVAAVDLGSSFLGPAVFLVAVTLGCSGASVTG